MNAADISISPGTVVTFKRGSDCRLTEIDALGRLWFARLWDGETSMVPAGPFQALVRRGDAVIRTAQESAAIELEYEQARQRADQRQVIDAVREAEPFLGRKRLLCDVRRATVLSRQDFDRVVLSCQADGLARLSRADLPELLPPGAEADSLIAVETEEYHFIEVTE